MSKEINDFIYGLNYDSRKLLAIPGESSKVSIPFFSDETQGTQYILCTNTPKDISADFYDISILNGIEGIIYPGALVRVNQDLAMGRPSPISSKRKEMTLNVNLPGLQDKSKLNIKIPTNSEVHSAIDKSLDYWFNNCSEYSVISKQQITTSNSFSDEQTAINLGFHLSWASADIKSNLKKTSNTTKTCVISMYKQIFYTVSLDTPTEPSDFFSDDTKVENLKASINNDNPLGYVRSIDYGRTYFIKIESNSANSELYLQNALKASIADKKIETDFDIKTQEILKTSTISIIILGGNATEGARIIKCATLSELNTVLSENAELKKNNLGIPVSYTVAFAKDNSVAIVSTTTSYVEKKYEIFDKTSFSFNHTGGYITEFIYQYNERTVSQDGKLVIKPQYISTGYITAPFSKSFDIPGNCCDIKLSAGEMTGLIWDYWGDRSSWREIFNRYVSTSSNIEISIWGTTLSPQYEIKS